MNFFNQYRGHLICAGLGILVGVFGVLWLKKQPQIATTNPVVDNPPAVQPVFVHDTVFQRLGGSIGKIAIPESITMPPETVYQQPSPCKPFSLHLKSSPTSLSSVLDSVVVSYFYPSGMNNFEYYTVLQKPRADYQSAIPILKFGIGSNYYVYQSKVDMTASLTIALRRIQLQGGYRIVGASHPSWFVGVRKEWRVF